MTANIDDIFEKHKQKLNQKKINKIVKCKKCGCEIELTYDELFQMVFEIFNEQGIADEFEKMKEAMDKIDFDKTI